MRNRFLPAPRPRLLVTLLAASMALLSACAAMHTLGLWSGAQTGDAFHGVSFGDSIADVRMRYRAGEPQTAPYGAPAWRLRDVTVDGITFAELIYEFTGDGGMQLVMAAVDPASCAPLHSRLSERFGAPLGAAEFSSVGKPSFTWHPGSGERVTLDCGAGWLVMLGPGGKALEHDIDLRERQHDFAS